MNLSPRWVDYLAKHGYKATYWAEVGSVGAMDLEIVEFARVNDCVILTNDLDFGTVLSITGGVKPSVVQIRANDIRPESIGDHVVLALTQAEKELEAGALVTVLSMKSRIRILPLFKQEQNENENEGLS